MILWQTDITYTVGLCSRMTFHINFFDVLLQAEPLRVCITGAAGQIAYSLLYPIAKGDVFGPNQV